MPSGRGGVSHGLLEDLRVDASHSVDSMGPSDAQVGHVNALHCFLLHKRHAPQPVYVPWECGCHPLCQESPELAQGPRTRAPAPYPPSSAQSPPCWLSGPTPRLLTFRKRWLIS